MCTERGDVPATRQQYRANRVFVAELSAELYPGGRLVL